MIDNLPEFHRELIEQIENGIHTFSPKEDSSLGELFRISALDLIKFQPTALALIELKERGYITCQEHREVISGNIYFERISDCRLIKD